MKTSSLWISVLLFAVGMASVAVTQSPAIAQNTWTSGAALPTALAAPAVGALKGKIYVVGGVTDTSVIANNQIYNPVSNTWSAGADLPVTTYSAASAVVKNILYVIGGTPDGTTVTNAVWAYNPTTNTWSGKVAMPTARVAAVAAVYKSVIYVIGGQDAAFNALAIVESYNPATNTWTEETPLLTAKSFLSAGALGSTIVAADGRSSSGDTGDNEGYSVLANSWRALIADPTGRDNACAGSISGRLYIAGGRVVGGAGTPALSLSESFKLSKNSWATLASMPQATQATGSTVYKGQLFCFGGRAVQAGSVISNVQIYQP